MQARVLSDTEPCTLLVHAKQAILLLYQALLCGFSFWKCTDVLDSVLLAGCTETFAHFVFCACSPAASVVAV